VLKDAAGACVVGEPFYKTTDVNPRGKGGGAAPNPKGYVEERRGAPPAASSSGKGRMEQGVSGGPFKGGPSARRTGTFSSRTATKRQESFAVYVRFRDKNMEKK